MLLYRHKYIGSATGLAGRPYNLHASSRKVCSMVPHCIATEANFADRAEGFLQRARDMRLGPPHRAAELSPVTSDADGGVKLQYVNLVMEGTLAIGCVCTQTNNQPDVAV